MVVATKKIAVIGLGYVGLPLAVEFAKIRPVLGFDLDFSRLKELSSGYDRTLECSSKNLEDAKGLELTGNVSDLKEVDIYIITVPTPIDGEQRPDLSHLKDACETVGRVLSSKNIVIFESTVYPGATEEICAPLLEKFSQLIFNVDFFCGYSPERINPGDKVNTITKIPKITSGSDEATALEVDGIYSDIIGAGTYLVSCIKVAEAAKVIENTQRDLNIAFVNELSMIFHHIGIDTMEVLEAAGTKWNFLPFKPGLVGGHCIGVDPYYLTHKAKQAGYSPEIILAGRRLNNNMPSFVANTVIKKMARQGMNLTNCVIGVLGITFKENCPDTRNSKIVDLINQLKDWGVKIVVSDPWANPEEVLNQYGIELSTVGSNEKFDSLIVAVGHSQYRNMSPKNLIDLCKGPKPVIADLKSLYCRHELNELEVDLLRL